jgi:AcrR family transcriptional regulator
MSPAAPSSSRKRILQAALTLLETGGPQAVSSRAVSTAADVQSPTIYRHFGDMQGLLDAAAIAGLTAYIQRKESQQTLSDPVEQVREGWKMHVEFGLAHPHLYALINGSPRPNAPSPATVQANDMLRSLMQRLAEAGLLAVSVDRAAAMIQAAVQGTTLSLLSSPVKDNALSDLMLEAVLRAILTPESEAAPGAIAPQATAHAVSLVALLPSLETPFSEAEKRLLEEWLQRMM